MQKQIFSPPQRILSPGVSKFHQKQKVELTITIEKTYPGAQADCPGKMDQSDASVGASSGGVSLPSLSARLLRRSHAPDWLWLAPMLMVVVGRN